jgi:hypothetical protein
MVSDPAPLILAPIFIKQLVKSTTSGSFAALRIVVVPSAKQAAIITFSVPVTLTGSKDILAPLSLPFAEAFM